MGQQYFIRHAIIAAILVIAAGRSVVAGTVTYSFSGNITFVNSFLGSELAAGNPLSGTVTYDTDVIDSSPTSSTVGTYSGALTEFSLTFNGTGGPLNIALDGLSTGTVAVSDVTSGNDSFQVSLSSTEIDGDTLNSFNPILVSIVDLGSASMFSTKALPTSADFLDEILFGTRKVEWLKPGFGALPVFFNINSYAAVPEPSGLVLAALGAVLLLAGLRQRRAVRIR